MRAANDVIAAEVDEAGRVRRAERAAALCASGDCGHEAYDAECADYVATACCGTVVHVDDVYADDVCDDCFQFVPDGIEVRMVDGFLEIVVR
jgi:hypothetical protein